MGKANFAILGTIVAIGGLHLATLRPGHEWGDDFSLYVAHARNLAEGRPYADTGYVYNPHFPSLSPRTYPPGFPLLLAPVYRICGMDLQAMKAFVVLLFAVFLWVLSILLRRRLPLPYVLACLLLVGLNPRVWQHKDRLLSEVPFMLFAYLALLLAERACAGEQPARRSLTWGILAGLTAYLAFATRTVGVVLVPAMLGCDFLRRRRLGLGSLGVAAAFAAGVLVQKTVLPLDGSYLDQLEFDPIRYILTSVSLVKGMGLYVENGYSAGGLAVLYACLLALAAPAFVLRLRERPTSCEWFAAGNLLLLAVWPYPEQRYLMPLLPLFFLHVCEGLHRLANTRWGRLELPAAAGLALAILVSYAGSYSRLEVGPPHQGVSTPEATALFEWVKTHTRPEDVLLFQKPRALALYTGRRASAHHVPASDADLWHYLRQIGSTHLIVCRQFENSRLVLEPFVARHAGSFRKVYGDDVFAVYRIAEASLASR
jgi:4-amino-4-deoxy-L-arabinose transferase-like glycosyltransferase